MDSVTVFSPALNNVALLGLGTVGGGVYKLIQRRSESMIHTVGAELEVEKILVHSLHKKREGVDTELLKRTGNRL